MSDFGDFREEPVDITRNGHIDVVSGEFEHEFEKIAPFGEVVSRLKQKPVHGHASADQEFQRTDEEVVEFGAIEVADTPLSFFVDASV